MSLAPLQLIAAHPWRRVTFTTYALSLSFFEAVILDALIRGRGREALILSDLHGVRASLSEQGAQRVGKDYEVEPVSVSSGVFHPKISVFSGEDDCHLLVGSGNLTFGGWGGNFEVLEHLQPSFAADALEDAAEFFELLPGTERVKFAAGAQSAQVAAALRRSTQGKARNGSIRLFHSLDKSISEQLVQVADDLGGATRLIAAAPFWDDGAVMDRLCTSMRLDEVFIHAHPYGTVVGTAGANWPLNCRSTVHSVQLHVMTENVPKDKKGRRLHGKAFEIMCRRGRMLVSGSPNGTAAALESGNNIEACIVRIQSARTVGWTFVRSEVPEPQSPLDEEDDEDGRQCGVLRAVLDGEDLDGEILTPAMSGAVSIFYLSNMGQEILAETTLSANHRFHLSAAALEQRSWLPGRLVIRVEDRHGRLAEGFVSVASFGEITRRAGLIGRRLLALLVGTETPADIAAIMSWFHEDPRRLADMGPDPIGNGSIDAATSGNPEQVVVAELSEVATRTNASAAGLHPGKRPNWSRFMDHILAAFRQRRGPFGRAGSAGKGDDDDDETNEAAPELEVEDPAIRKSLAAFEKLLDLLLKTPVSARNTVTGFDLAEYICERLQPDAVQARNWLERLVKVLLDAGVPPERRADVAAAVLTLVGSPSVRTGPRWARRCLIRLNVNLSGEPPSAGTVQGFQSVLVQSAAFPTVWSQISEVRTYAEQIQSYLAVLNKTASNGDYADLPGDAAEEWPILKAALTSETPFTYIALMKPSAETCPKCNIGLPTRELGKLRSIGLATAKNCCRRVLIRAGD